MITRMIFFVNTMSVTDLAFFNDSINCFSMLPYRPFQCLSTPLYLILPSYVF